MSIFVSWGEVAPNKIRGPPPVIQLPEGPGRDIPRTANLRTKILDFRGFDSSTILILRRGILMSMGNCPGMLSQQILVGIILVGRLGVERLTAKKDRTRRAQLRAPHRSPAAEDPGRAAIAGSGDRKGTKWCQD